MERAKPKEKQKNQIIIMEPDIRVPRFVRMAVCARKKVLGLGITAER